jgi:hypothetical protein
LNAKQVTSQISSEKPELENQSLDDEFAASLLLAL